MGDNLDVLLDHITDVAGIATIGVLALNGDVGAATIGAIVSIAIGKRYARGKWSNKTE